MNPPEIAIVTHDTHRIIYANPAACALWRAELWQLVDQPLAEGAAEADMKWLIALRMKAIRDKGELRPQRLAFLRLDGSIFWAECKTRKLEGGLFETEIRYISEHLKP